jgi:hypothetical protein
MLSDGGAQIMVQGLPERAELVKLGASWGAAIPTASAFTYVAAWPTTRSELILFNGETAGGPTYVVDRAWMTDITTGATGGRALLAQLVPAPNVAGVTGTIGVSATVLTHQLSGRAINYGGNAKLHLADTLLPAIANQWFPLGTIPSVGGVTTIGTTVEANLYGRLLVPPGAALCLAGVAGAASGTAILGVDWHEVLMNLG